MTPLSCPSCGATLPEGASACSYCGRRVASEPRMAATVSPLDSAAGSITGTGTAGARRAVLLIILASVLMLGLGLLVAALLAGQAAESDPVPVTHRVDYRVSGGVRNVTVTYTNGTGGTEQREVRVPWTRSLIVKDAGYIYIVAMSMNETGTLTCEIKLDGVPWKEATSSGSNVLATCGGVPDGP